MRETFFGYYPPTDAEYAHLWKEGLVVLDTNVLLYLYKAPVASRTALLDVLEKLKDRLWIPHQVALEFQNRRLSVIASERKSTEEALTTTSDAVSQIREKVESLEIDKRGLGLDSATLLAELDKASTQLHEAMSRAHSEQLDISGTDPIRASLDALFKGRVGKGPVDQADLNELMAGGEDRFADRIPPGFMDADKDKNPVEAKYVFDQLRYTRKFGDLILWRQLLKHVSENKIKSVMFVTGDSKEDWWWRVQGKTIGPHSELAREIRRVGRVESFWMYSFLQFMENANKYIQAAVSKESLNEIQEVTSRFHQNKKTLYWYKDEESLLGFSDSERTTPASQFDSRVDEAVREWVSLEDPLAQPNPGKFPDLISPQLDGIHGYEIKVLRHARQLGSAFQLDEALLRGLLQMRSGQLVAFHLIVVLTEDDVSGIKFRDAQEKVVAELRNYIKSFPVSSVCIGIMVSDRFVKLVRVYSAES